MCFSLWQAPEIKTAVVSCEYINFSTTYQFFFATCSIKEFNEWAQCLVMELVAKYIPSDNSEIFDIMNLLEDRLQHANGAVVLATTKVFLHLTLSMADVHQQVCIDLRVCVKTSFILPVLFATEIFVWSFFHKLHSLA
jgi:hypothetical protein